MNRHFKNKGFTLIEIIIVVAIVAILAAIAFPSYKDQIRKGRRNDAKAALMDLALQQEKWRANNPTYAAKADLNTTFPTTANEYYEFDVTVNSTTAFTITADPKNSTDQANDKCEGSTYAFLSLDQSNNKAPPACW